MKRSLQKELEFYTNLLAQHEKKISQNPATSNKEYLSCSASGSMNSSCVKTESNVIHNHVLKTNFSKIKQNKHIFNKNKSVVKLSTKVLSPKSLASKLPKNNIINKSVEISSISKPINEVKRSLQVKLMPDPFAKLSNKNCNKLDSKKLMGEILALTNQLKLKSGTFNSSNKTRNHNLNLDMSVIMKKDSSSAVKSNSISLKASDISIPNVKYFDTNHHVYKKNHNFVNQSKMAALNTTFVAQSLNKKVGPVNSQIKITNLSMMKKLGEVKKVLADSTKKRPKEKPNHIDLKKNSVEVTVKGEASTGKNISTEKDPLIGRMKDENISYCLHKKVSLSNVKTLNALGKPNCQNRNKTCLFKNKFSIRFQNTKSLPFTIKNLNSKYKVINKKESPKSSLLKVPEKNISKSTNYSSAKRNIYRLNNNKIYSSQLKSGLSYKTIKNHSTSSSLFNGVSRESMHVMKKLPCNKILLRASPNAYRLRSKYHLNKINLSSTKVVKLSESNDSRSDQTLKNDVDVDLLLELAAEKKEKLAIQRFYRSDKRNNGFVQAKTVRMIKSKYFRTTKRSLLKNMQSSHLHCEGSPRNYLSRNLKFGNNYNKMKFQSKKHFLSLQQKKKLNLQKKKIVSLEGEKFIVCSTGKTLKKIKPSMKTKKVCGFKKTPLKKYTFIKNNNLASKAIASRVLNRSINRVISASAKKKMEKVNTYCMFYNRFGRCNKGMECSYVHDPSKIAVCTRFLRGTCKNDKCLFSHETDPGKMAICTFFLQDACTKDDCPYRHEKLSSNAELCKAFVQGYCADGKECKKAHVLICLKYIQGICDKGKDCIFPHPDNTKKTSDSKSTKENDNIFENVLRYYEVLPNESSPKGLVVPRVKILPEQPSFISLTMDENS